MPKYHQGKFKPKNPGKYIDKDVSNIVYRSGWELKLMRHLDRHPNVTRWGSEVLVIPYYSPIDGKMHRYFTDFYVERLNKDGKKDVLVIEVKPKKETIEPDFTKKMTKKGSIRKSYLREVKTWGVNKAKWEAADAYCKDRGWTFQIMTEHELGIK